MRPERAVGTSSAEPSAADISERRSKVSQVPLIPGQPISCRPHCIRHFRLPASDRHRRWRVVVRTNKVNCIANGHCISRCDWSDIHLSSRPIPKRTITDCDDANWCRSSVDYVALGSSQGGVEGQRKVSIASSWCCPDGEAPWPDQDFAACGFSRWSLCDNNETGSQHVKKEQQSSVPTKQSQTKHGVYCLAFRQSPAKWVAENEEKSGPQSKTGSQAQCAMCSGISTNDL